MSVLLDLTRVGKGTHGVGGSNPYELGLQIRKRLQELGEDPSNYSISFSNFNRLYIQALKKGLRGEE